MKLVLDTNAYCLCDTGHEAGLRAVEQASALFIPVLVFGELYYGFKYGTRLHENLRRLGRFIKEFEAEVILVDLPVARKFGDIYSSLRKKGRPIPTNDIWIAACCLEVSGTLLTADRHFNEIDHLEIEFLEE